MLLVLASPTGLMTIFYCPCNILSPDGSTISEFTEEAVLDVTL
jgi:hypothetical protein